MEQEYLLFDVWQNKTHLKRRYNMTNFLVFSGSTTSGGNTSLQSILSMGSELMTWVIKEMTALLTFITANPLILTFFIMTIVGFVVGFLMRIWHSA